MTDTGSLCEKAKIFFCRVIPRLVGGSGLYGFMIQAVGIAIARDVVGQLPDASA